MAKARRTKSRPFRVVNPLVLTGQEARDGIEAVIHKMTPTRYTEYLDSLSADQPVTV